MRYKIDKYILIFFFYLTSGGNYAQLTDTTIQKKRYTFCDYYPGSYDRLGLETEEPKTLFSLGNYEDSLKSGHWLYFYPSGSLLAEGNYEKGLKTGKWKYYSGNGIYSVVKFSAKVFAREQISFTSYNYPEIYDYFGTNEWRNYLLNGKFPSACFNPHPRGMD